MNQIDEIIKGYQNYLGNFNIEEMIFKEVDTFYLNNGDYINPKIGISFDEKKGIKIIAKEDIKEGERILFEKSFYCSRKHVKEDDMQTYFKLKYPPNMIYNREYIECINNLIKILKKSPLDYIDFFVLYNGENLNQNYEKRKKNLPENLLSILNTEFIEKIFKFNYYNTVRDFYYGNRIAFGLWKFLSFFNHDCLPNTSSIGIGDFIMLFSNKLIKKGEEITILYFGRPTYYKWKKELFKKIYNFECNCCLCQIEKESRKKYPKLLFQYDKFIYELGDDYPSNEKLYEKIKEFSEFLNQNEKYLSNYEIGRGYHEIQKNCLDFENSYKYYKLLDKYLKNINFEIIKVSLNNICAVCNQLTQEGDNQSKTHYNDLYYSFIKFYEIYGKFSETETLLLIQSNLLQKKKDYLINIEKGLELKRMEKIYEEKLK